MIKIEKCVNKTYDNRLTRLIDYLKEDNKRLFQENIKLKERVEKQHIIIKDFLYNQR